MSDSTPPDPSNEPKGGLPRPPLATILIWMLIIFVPLVFLWASRLDWAPKKAESLSQSEFEKALVDGQVLKVKWVYVDGRYDNLIEGTYKKPGAKEPETRFQVATGPYSDRLDALIATKVPARESEKRVNWLYPILFNYLPLLLLFVILYVFFMRQVKRGGGAFEFGKSRARLWNPHQNKITFNDVCGIDEAKEELQEIVDYLKDPGKFQRLGGRIPRGVLMVGPPGTGKTLLARAIAGEAGVPFFSISGSDFVEMFVGVGASRVRDMFEEAIRNAPCLIFIDEIDAVGRSRFTGIGGGHDEREQTLNALLVQMDGFEQNTGVIVIAATNRPDVLDPALLRPGRFDRQVTVDLPDVAGRYAILKLHAAKTKLAAETNLHSIARGTAGFSGADLANLINEAALLAARHNKEQVEQHDLEEARDKVLWGKERRSRKIDDQERRLIAFHEAGHALAGLHCKHAEALHKITIIPRGNAYLGATMNIPESDRYTRSRNWFFDELVVLFGGRVAEQLEFNDISTGASQDIRQATAIAKKMVCEWGMTDRLGPVNYGGRGEHIYLGRDITRSEDYSEVTAREIDEEIRALVDAAYRRTTDILSEHRDQLGKLATALLERETLTAVEVYELLGMEEKLAEARRAQEESTRKQQEEMAQAAGAQTAKPPPQEPSDEERQRQLEALDLEPPPPPKE